MSKGRLIIIEAGDGSGKATQTKMLYERLCRDGHKVKKVTFPDYESESSALVKMYLGGSFGSHAADVNAYAASVFFAADRYASFMTKWKEEYEAGTIILADRYTTSNMVHQAVKMDEKEKRDAFLQWLWDFEFNKLELPVPDLVVFLNMAPEVSDMLLAQRGDSKHQGKDIHEADKGYLHKCHEAYLELSEKYGWKSVICSQDGRPRSRESIHQDVYSLVIDSLKTDRKGADDDDKRSISR